MLLLPVSMHGIGLVAHFYNVFKVLGYFLYVHSCSVGVDTAQM